MNFLLMIIIRHDPMRVKNSQMPFYPIIVNRDVIIYYFFGVPVPSEIPFEILCNIFEKVKMSRCLGSSTQEPKVRERYLIHFSIKYYDKIFVRS
jgi:hypothetical protein